MKLSLTTDITGAANGEAFDETGMNCIEESAFVGSS